MAEIYNFLAGKQKIEAEQREANKIEKPEKEKEKEEKPVRIERVNLLKMTELMLLVASLISRANGNPHREAYQAKYNLVKTYTDEEVIGWINNFNKLQVNTEPLFYSALIDVAMERKLSPSMLDK